MAQFLTFISSAATAATRGPTFPGDEPLDDPAAVRAVAGGLRPQRFVRMAIAPELAARQTAEELSLTGGVDGELRGLDYGRWKGLSLADVMRSEPEAVATWLSDPAAAPHGGESIGALIARIGDWMASGPAERGRTVVVAPAEVVRAAVLHALGAPAEAFWRLDLRPLSLTELGSDGRRWTLRTFGLWRFGAGAPPDGE